MNLYKINKDKWSYYSGDIAEESSVIERYQPILDLWHKTRGEKLMPRWRDFDFADFIGWHANMFLADIQREPFDMYYRLFGSAIAETYDGDFTGKWMSELDGSVEDVDDQHHFKHLVLDRKIGASHGPLHWIGKNYYEVYCFDLPLSTDGENVTQIMTFVTSETIPESQRNF